MIFPPQAPPVPAVGSSAPDVTFRRRDGTSLRLATLRGRMVVVEFTAYSCPPCRVLAPKLEEFARSEPDVVFLCVAVRSESELAELAALRAKDARTILLQDRYDKDRSKMGVWRFGNVGTPTMFLITPKGKIGSRALQLGSDDLPRLKSRIDWVRKRGL